MNKITILLVSIVLAIPSIVAAGGEKDYKCDTKYPVVLAHGMGASADIELFGVRIMEYWYGIDDALEDEGAEVLITSVNGMDSTVAKAEDFNRQVLEYMAISGSQKVNIIGHSHGCIYSRYAISNLGLAPYVASHTSMAGPHRGSSVADAIMYGVPESLHGLVETLANSVYSILFGNDDPDSLQNGWDVTRPAMVSFNANTPNISSIYYQSYAAKIKTGDLLMEIPWLICAYYEGANDGLVSVNSARWGEFQGVIDGAWWCDGVSHLELINMMLGVTPGFDAPALFVEIVEGLKGRGL